MTEQEREGLIKQIATAIAVYAKDDEDDWWIWEPEARAALAVAEPVIREECAGIADKHSSEVSVSKFATATNALCAQKMAKDIAAAIREGGDKDD